MGVFLFNIYELFTHHLYLNLYVYGVKMNKRAKEEDVLLSILKSSDKNGLELKRRGTLLKSGLVQFSLVWNMSKEVAKDYGISWKANTRGGKVKTKHLTIRELILDLRKDINIIKSDVNEIGTRLDGMEVAMKEHTHDWNDITKDI